MEAFRTWIDFSLREFLKRDGVSSYSFLLTLTLLTNNSVERDMTGDEFDALNTWTATPNCAGLRRLSPIVEGLEILFLVYIITGKTKSLGKVYIY